MPFDDDGRYAPKPPPTPSEILTFIRAKFTSGEWKWGRCPWPEWETTERMCLTSALWEECDDRLIEFKSNSGLPSTLGLPAESEEALAYLAEAICELPHGEPDGEDCIVVEEWNDAEGRTLEDVLNILNKAIAQAEDVS